MTNNEMVAHAYAAGRFDERHFPAPVVVPTPDFVEHAESASLAQFQSIYNGMAEARSVLRREWTAALMRSLREKGLTP